MTEEEFRSEVKIAAFVCRHRQEHGGKEYRFTKEWTLTKLATAHPRHVAVRCPRCGWAWYVDFEQWLPPRQCSRLKKANCP
jgi:hypothetical protein